jgi:hypothetical protein
VVLNQFDQIGNAIWHYVCTGRAMEEVFETQSGDGLRMSAVCLTQGSAGTLGSAEYLREVYPRLKVVAAEAAQCPTLLYNGYGAHRIEGIGDKHVPWIHNVKNTDVVVDIDDQDCMSLLRLFNEPQGRAYLEAQGIDSQLVRDLSFLGISSIANLLTAVKTARYFEMTDKDVIMTVATDSMDMYGSRFVEERERLGEYSETRAAVHHERCLLGAGMDEMLELSYWDRRRMHNLKYFTWVEQQGKSVEELDAQWYDDNYWRDQFHAYEEWDRLITDFNRKTGLLEDYS